MRMKALVVAGAVVGIAVLARSRRPNVHGFDVQQKMVEHWEKTFERMPENAPPKWMFRNISAIRQNTDRILELLQQQRTEQEHATGAVLVP